MPVMPAEMQAVGVQRMPDSDVVLIVPRQKTKQINHTWALMFFFLIHQVMYHIKHHISFLRTAGAEIDVSS